jgi:hypothetical protein
MTLMVDASTSRLRESVMPLLDHFVLAGGERTFDTPDPIGYAPTWPAGPAVLLPDDRPGGRQTHLALTVEDEGTVRRGHEFATAAGAGILHETRLWPEYGPAYYPVLLRDPAGNNLELMCRASTAQPIHPHTTEEHAS